MKCVDFRARHATFTALPLAREVFESDECREWSDHLHDCRDCSEWDMLNQVKARGVDVSSFPCVHLAYYSTEPCDVHADAWECPDMTLVRSDSGFGIPVRDGGQSVIEIAFCPWCGVPC